VGANPVDRAKPGSKLHLAVEGTGMPLSLLVTGANTNDSLVFEALLDDIPRVRTRLAGGAAGPTSATPTRPTTTAAAAPT
jgi:Transposase DDE domain